MTPPKILYSFIEGQHKFYGLVGMPEKPIYQHGSANTEYKRWVAECARLMENAPEIVNKEALVIISEDGKVFHIPRPMEVVELNHGDQFPLPNGLELREELQVSHSVDKSTWYDVKDTEPSVPDKCYRKVFRIVKTEVKPEPESQENMMQELLQEYRNLRKRKATSFSIALTLLDKFTIQRKKP